MSFWLPIESPFFIDVHDESLVFGSMLWSVHLYFKELSLTPDEYLSVTLIFNLPDPTSFTVISGSLVSLYSVTPSIPVNPSSIYKSS